MTPEDVQYITDLVSKEENNTVLYVIISLFVVLTPVVIWAAKIIFKKTVDQVVDEAIKPQIELLEKTFERDNKANEQMFSIMEMHIDELRHIKFEVESNKKEISSNKEDIRRLKETA